MIHEYAMGTGVSSLRLADHPQSEAALRRYDAEVRELADEAYRAAVDVLQRHRSPLEQFAQRLLTSETLERDDIEAIMAGIPSARPDRRPGVHLGLAAAAAPDEPERSQ